MFKKAFSGVVALSLAASMALPASAYSNLQASASRSRQNSNQSIQNQQQNGGQQSQASSTSYTNSQQYMIDQGIMRGDGNGNYNMSGNLSRGAMMVMLVRAFDLSSDNSDSDTSNSDTSDSSGFSDVSAGSYYAEAINTARDLGIAKGNGTSFSPESNVTIQQAILFIERAAEQAGITLSGDLESYYEDSELSAYATREDIANLLYHTLTGSDSSLENSNGSGSSNTSDTDTADEITYTVTRDGTVTFDVDDFSDAVSEATDGETLSYVTFAVPSVRYGTLYYDYSSGSSSNTAVYSGTKYYVSEEQYLSDITFVADGSASGTVTIRYTGYTTDGTAVSGTVGITIEAAVADTFSYVYDADGDSYLLFDSSDFVSACEDVLGDDTTLSYVTFTLPSSSDGILYDNYSTSSESGTAVTDSTKCYLSNTPKLSKVAFVNDSDNEDDVTISYTGYATNGESFTGTILISVD